MGSPHDGRAAGADLDTVYMLCMLQLVARRLGCSIRVHDVTAELRDLIVLVGLEDVLLGTSRPDEPLDPGDYR